ncbi:MAG: diaminopimelate decarboxylase family protein [Bacteroidota bacterium]
MTKLAPGALPVATAIDFVDTYWGRSLLSGVDTPSVVYSEKRLADNAAVFLRQDCGVPHQVFFAMKACPMARVAKTFSAAGLGGEVQSSLELSLARAAGFPDDRLMLNGPRKPRAAARDLLEAGGRVVADSEDEFRTFLQVEGLGLGVRVNIGGESADTFIRPSDRFGVSLAVAEKLVGEARPPVMLHMHCLARCDSPQAILDSYQPLADWLRHHGPGFSRLNLGGGFNSRLRLGQARQSLDNLLRVHADMFGGFGLPLMFEPGRALVEDAAVAVTTVAAIKTGVDGSRWCMVDIGTNLLVPLPLARFTVIALDGGDKPTCSWAVADGTCSPAGVIDRHALLPETLAEGDRLLVLCCGAYTYSLAESFCDTIPPAYFLGRDGTMECMLSAEDSRLVADLLFGVRRS